MSNGFIFCKNKDKEFQGEAPRCPCKKEELVIVRTTSGDDDAMICKAKANQAIMDWVAKNRGYTFDKQGYLRKK